MTLYHSWKRKDSKTILDKELDCSYSLEGVARFRINVFYDRGRISAVMRALSSNIPTFNQLGLPASVQQLNRPRGLMLVTGPTGSEKRQHLQVLLIGLMKINLIIY